MRDSLDLLENLSMCVGTDGSRQEKEKRCNKKYFLKSELFSLQHLTLTRVTEPTTPPQIKF